ncbi:MAG: hypothetical protein GXP27_17630, partial [Planctomycetes bacterium]|nr:hypothetical protein [Planctomycetota bacterium]
MSLPFLPTELVQRLGWVLVHSVWQLALMAMVAAVLVGCLRGRSAAVRYWVLLFALVAMTAAPVATWWLLPADASSASISAASVGAHPSVSGRERLAEGEP